MERLIKITMVTVCKTNGSSSLVDYKLILIISSMYLQKAHSTHYCFEGLEDFPPNV